MIIMRHASLSHCAALYKLYKEKNESNPREISRDGLKYPDTFDLMRLAFLSNKDISHSSYYHDYGQSCPQLSRNKIFFQPYASIFRY